MPNTNKDQNNLGRYTTLANSRTYRKAKTELRVFIEAILMLFIGSNLILFLNSIPEKFVWKDFAQEALNNLSQGFVLLFEALVKIGAVVSIIFLLLFSMFLLIGGTLRIIKLIRSSRRNHQTNLTRKY